MAFITASSKVRDAAGRDSNTIAVFAIDGESGELIYTRNMVMAPTPICVMFGEPGS